MRRAIYAVDVGSTRCKSGQHPNFGWARLDPDTPETVAVSSDIERLADFVATDLQSARSVALGFEAPLFIPIPHSPDALCRGRVGEGNRSCMAPVGLAVTALGMHQAAWVLKAIADQVGDPVETTLRTSHWPPNGPRPLLFLWEAFVSGAAHGTSHTQDAATAAVEFFSHEQNLEGVNSVTAEPALSVIGAAVLWSGLSEDLSLLRETVLVIKPQRPYPGPITEL